MYLVIRKIELDKAVCKGMNDEEQNVESKNKILT